MIVRDSKGRIQLGPLEYFIQALIILAIIAFAFETLPNLSNQQRKILDGFEVFTIVIFSIEYIFRLAFSSPKKSYAFSFFGIIDLLAILPFYLTTGLDLRSLRIFRLFRLFRILKLARYSLAIQRFHRALIIVREELILYGAVSIILIFLSAVGIYNFENEAQPDKFTSIFDSLWWSIATLTTVGYGDIYPITAGGKLFTFFVLLLGLGLVAVPTGLVASALARAREEESYDKKGSKDNC